MWPDGYHDRIAVPGFGLHNEGLGNDLDVGKPCLLQVLKSIDDAV
jgi:hypothetical protein